MARPHPNEEDLISLSDRLLSHGADLISASNLIGAKPEDPRDIPVSQILKRCAELARGCANLGRSNNSTSLVILARAILENLILILWVMLEERNVAELENAAIAELSRAARINLESGRARIINRSTGADATAQFLSDGHIKSIPKRKTVETRAKEAGVLDLYNIFYRFLSLETHGHDLNSMEESGEFDLSVIHMQGIGALLSAIRHAGSQWKLYRQKLSNDDLRKSLGLA